MCAGCDWNPPRDNPLDPGYYRYRPVGRLEVVVVERGANRPLFDAEVRIPELNAFGKTDRNGLARFDSIPIGRYLVSAERRGEVPFALDSDSSRIIENGITRDTLRLSPLPVPPGSLSLRVLTLTQQPIVGATVLITEVGQFALSGADGMAHFGELPVGDWWVRAFRAEDVGAIYGRDSLLVMVRSLVESDTSIRLDALPIFSSVSANSVAYAEIRTQPDPYYFVRLKATVIDPDGLADLTRVESRLIDPSRADTLSVGLRFNPDSSFWWVDIPSDSFPDRLIDNALTLPFTLQAFDVAGNGSPLERAYLARVIHGVPSLLPVQPEARPFLRWNYSLYNEFSGITLFNYRIRIYRNTDERPLAHEQQVVPDNSSYNEYRTLVQLPSGNYLWEVWVLDLFGNSSRSAKDPLTIS